MILDFLLSTEVLLTFGGAIALGAGGFALKLLGEGARTKAEKSLTSDLRSDMHDGFEQLKAHSRELLVRFDGLQEDVRATRADGLATRQMQIQTQESINDLRKETREDMGKIHSRLSEHDNRISHLEAASSVSSS